MDGITTSPATRAEIAAEQDAAAGGRDARKVQFPNGTTATASVSLGSKREDGGYTASLRFKHERMTYRRQIGLVHGATREGALREAWRLAREKDMLVE